jgi:hypothetical protein
MPLYLWVFGAASKAEIHGETLDARGLLGIG